MKATMTPYSFIAVMDYDYGSVPIAATDYDGNVYTSVKIGTQEWLVENLKVTHYSDGTPIPNITDDVLWTADVNGGYCWYDNDISYKNPYGALYNWYVVNNPSILAITGWRVPTYADLIVLRNYLAVSIGGKLKETGTAHWAAPNTGATNEVGFTGVPGGSREDDGTFDALTIVSYLWSSTQFDLTKSWAVWFLYNNDIFYEGNLPFNWGFSVRLMRDI